MMIFLTKTGTSDAFWPTVWSVLANIGSLLTLIAFGVALVTIVWAIFERPKLQIKEEWETGDSGLIGIVNNGHRPARNFHVMVSVINRKPLSGGPVLAFIEEAFHPGVRHIEVVPEESRRRRDKGVLAVGSEDKRSILIFASDESIIHVHYSWTSAWIPGKQSQKLVKFDPSRRFAYAAMKQLGVSNV